MRAIEVYRRSDGEATRAYYAQLALAGPRGVIAVNLFRAQKCSARAKVYRGGIAGQGSYKRMAYDRKSWSMDQLCAALAQHGAALGMGWGWKRDPATLFGGSESWVLYVELPQGQVSFHSPSRGAGPEYAGEWDGMKASELRILQFCDAVGDGGKK